MACSRLAKTPERNRTGWLVWRRSPWAPRVHVLGPNVGGAYARHNQRQRITCLLDIAANPAHRKLTTPGGWLFPGTAAHGAAASLVRKHIQRSVQVRSSGCSDEMPTGGRHARRHGDTGVARHLLLRLVKPRLGTGKGRLVEHRRTLAVKARYRHAN